MYRVFGILLITVFSTHAFTAVDGFIGKKGLAKIELVADSQKPDHYFLEYRGHVQPYYFRINKRSFTLAQFQTILEEQLKDCKDKTIKAGIISGVLLIGAIKFFPLAIGGVGISTFLVEHGEHWYYLNKGLKGDFIHRDVVLKDKKMYFVARMLEKMLNF